MNPVSKKLTPGSIFCQLFALKTQTKIRKCGFDISGSFVQYEITEFLSTDYRSFWQLIPLHRAGLVP